MATVPVTAGRSNCSVVQPTGAVRLCTLMRYVPSALLTLSRTRTVYVPEVGSRQVRSLAVVADVHSVTPPPAGEMTSVRGSSVPVTPTVRTRTRSPAVPVKR